MLQTGYVIQTKYGRDETLTFVNECQCLTNLDFSHHFYSYKMDLHSKFVYAPACHKFVKRFKIWEKCLLSTWKKEDVWNEKSHATSVKWRTGDEKHFVKHHKVAKRPAKSFDEKTQHITRM